MQEGSFDSFEKITPTLSSSFLVAIHDRINSCTTADIVLSDCKSGQEPSFGSGSHS
jgi:hypothetical protein